MLSSRAAICRRHKAVPALCLALVFTSLAAPPAESRHWRHHRHAHSMRYHHGESIRYHHESARPASFSAIVVDANSGRSLYARGENELRYPASITKVMTLYLLFEQLERGTLRLDSTIRISSKAASQKPTKLGLRAGEAIRVEDAIRAVVTRSANDIAVAIAEAIAGDEENFAGLMTAKAHALGMASTHFANSSGLPDPDQVTTARDLAILGRAIQDRFPRYYHYFATRAFYFRGAAIANHNHLLDRVEGMDGIKTGFTNASGFNLLASVRRGGHHIVAVVLGGATARSRDRIMADLIEDHIEDTATIRTARPVTEAPAFAQMQSPAVMELPKQPPAAPRKAPPDPASAKITLRALPPPSAQSSGQSASSGSFNGALLAERPNPAFVSGAPRPLPAGFDTSQDDFGWKQASLDGSTARARPEPAATTPPAIETSTPRPGKLLPPAGLPIENSTIKADEDLRPAAARTGWMIQIGATPDLEKASELLARAKSEGPRSLLRARAFTEKIQKGPETLYRARFAGLQEESAELACKALKRSGFSCFATKN